MALNKTDFLEDELLDHVLRNAAYTAPVTVFAALSTTTINDDGTGMTEPVGNGYARTAIVFDAPVAGVVDNQLVTFPQASGGNWGTITDMAIMSLAVAGDMLYYGVLTAPLAVNDTDTARFSAGALTVQEQ